MELLLAQPRARIPVEVLSLQYAQKIRFDTMENYCRLTCCTIQTLMREDRALRDGVTISTMQEDGRLYLVLYNKNVASRARAQFTLAHEVGHICLAHRDDSDKNEALANHFAAELLMPRILVRELLTRPGLPSTAHEVARIFGVSPSAAKRRLQSAAFSGHDCSTAEHTLLRRYSLCLPCSAGPVVGF